MMSYKAFDLMICYVLIDLLLLLLYTNIKKGGNLMDERFSDYADNYKEYLEFVYYLFNEREPLDGEDAQREGLYFLEEDKLTERERLIMMLSVIKWEIEHNMLTDELRDELDYYYNEFLSGRLKEHIYQEDRIAITKDLTECYQKVFK